MARVAGAGVGGVGEGVEAGVGAGGRGRLIALKVQQGDLQ